MNKLSTAKAVKTARTARKSEAELIVAYPNIVPGSLKMGRKDGAHAGKMTCAIRTFTIDGLPNGKTRKVATSDLFQVRFTADTKAAFDKLPAVERDAVKTKIAAWMTAKH